MSNKYGISGKTSRGFSMVSFEDSYGTPSNIMCSSIVGDYEDSFDRPGTSAVWIGVDKVESKVMAKDAHLLGIQVNDKTGWVDYPIPEEVSLQASMHLNREQVEGLIGRLQEWLDTGEFK